MQRYITVRVLRSLLALWVMSLIVFSLARITGDPMDALLPMEADPEDMPGLPSTGGWISLCIPST